MLHLDSADENELYQAMDWLLVQQSRIDTKAGIHVISLSGKLLKVIPVWEDTLTNCAFGGPGRKTRYITAGKTLFRTRVDIPGLPR